MLRSAVLALATLVLTLSVGLATLPGVPIGDANGDGVTNSIDAILVLQLSAGILERLDRAPKEGIADVNHDGVVNVIDAQLILQYDAGLYRFPTPTIILPPTPTVTP